ncbi:DUF4913 domain-containing protein [Rhodococcoides yunnanense]|jgi:hypothetical protein|uniref:DUF4913 domain-containing protein n=1 Tax=Rhodococcoides yunnanense TaxID=278209 RepID=UPI0022B0C9A7|nr:DUF4913 domain-containing protein [Rhodococcus yunnanensis]MCZ4277415.1 DUF4913 domain-containing protein [Rhodococcus yunnanensis]
MSGDNDDEFDIVSTEPEATEPSHREPKPAAPNTSVAESMPQELIDDAVDWRLRREANRIAEVLFEERLTPELHQQMLAAARRRMDAQLIVDLRAQQDAAAATEEEAANPPKLVYANKFDFFDDYLSDVYRREVTTGTQKSWCLSWWKHTEAVIVVEALWRSWEKLRTDPGTGLSVWKKDHADHHMNVLFDPNGTFAKCSVRNGHYLLDPLPSEPIPVALRGEPVEQSPLST